MPRVLSEQTPLIHSENWDILVILDACRYDYFVEEVNGVLEGRLEEVWSDGTNTFDWLRNTFPGHYGFTYVSGNPVIHSARTNSLFFAEKYRGYRPREHFGKIVDVWKSGWDEELGATLPGKVTEAVLKEGGRIIAHYLQPHAPYIGRTRLVCGKTANSNWDSEIWERVKSGEISLALLRRAYRENLRLVLGEVKRLREAVGGVMVVTADHGEFLGEEGILQHGVDDQRLTEVPWFQC